MAGHAALAYAAVRADLGFLFDGATTIAAKFFIGRFGSGLWELVGGGFGHYQILFIWKGMYGYRWEIEK